MKLIDVLRLRAVELDVPQEIAVDCVVHLLADLRKHYRTSGESGLVAAINQHTEDAFSYVQRRVPMPEPLAPDVSASAASRIQDELLKAVPHIIAVATGSIRRADRCGVAQ